MGFDFSIFYHTSDYLNHRRAELDLDTAKAIEDIKANIVSRRPSPPNYGNCVKVCGIIGVLFGFFMAAIRERFSFGFSLLCGLGGLIIGNPIYGILLYSNKMANKKLDNEQNQRIDEAQSIANERYSDYMNKYIQNTTKIRIEKGNNASKSQATNKIYRWLMDGFSEQIRMADRPKHIKWVVIQYSFSVHASEIVVDNYRRFDFVKERVNSFTSFIEQVGYAQAMAMILQAEIKKAFPYDPSDPTKYRSIVEITTANDENMVLTYRAVNGYFEHAQST